MFGKVFLFAPISLDSYKDMYIIASTSQREPCPLKVEQ
jgi:hypothetical protein